MRSTSLGAIPAGSSQSFVGYVEGAVGFPNISKFPECHPGPYERQMGGYIVGLLNVLAGRVPDAESHTHIAELAANPNRWSAGHAVFDEIRARLLVATKRGEHTRSAQYAFEESCCQAMYNATDPPDPSSAFYVVPEALGLARLAGVPLDAVAHALAQKG
jgi:hypothetical protein